MLILVAGYGEVKLNIALNRRTKESTFWLINFCGISKEFDLPKRDKVYWESF